ncbi:DUF3829 domain-containing protein, partial [Escherichia coli]|uniref:DUF3829 domain-containing protein n=1 Tax=Escherichia coli TaxID=562 RepID=UPI00208E8F8B
ADRNRSHWSTSKTPSYTKSVSWHHHPQDKFDAEAAMKKVSELETLVAQAKEADKGGMNFSFINSAGQYQLEAKKYVRRIRDKVPYSDWDKEQLQDANSSWMVEDSFPRALREYNEMVDDYNSLR